MEVLSGYVMVVWNINDHLRDIQMITIESNRLKDMLYQIASVFNQPGVEFRILKEPRIWIKQNSEENDIHPDGSECIAMASISSEHIGNTMYFCYFDGDPAPSVLVDYKIRETEQKAIVI